MHRDRSSRPFFEMGMARMSTVSDRFEQFVEAWDAAAILGRSVSCRGGQYGHLSPGECGGIFRAVIIKKLSDRY